MPQPPPSVVYGNPSGDPGCDLLAYIVEPDPVLFPGPRPGIVFNHSGGYSDGGPAPVFNQNIPGDFAAEGFLAIYIDTRLMKGPPQGGMGLPGQTTDGRYQQQTDDYSIGVRYCRAHPLCDGFVAGLGGSGGGGNTGFKGAVGTVGDDRLDCVVSLSSPTDYSDRDADALANPHFIAVVQDYGRSTDLPTLLSESWVSKIDSSMCKTYFANGRFEPMPWTQATRLEAAFIAAGKVAGVDYIFHENLNNGGTQHSFGTWPENKTAAIAFVKAAHATWNGGGGGGLKDKPKGLYCLLPAPDGFIGDISSYPFLTNSNLVGARIRCRWNVIQPSSEGVYDWSEIDNALAKCTAKGKLAGISIAAGVGTPAWVYVTAPTCTKFTLANDDQADPPNADMPLPWQPHFLTHWTTFVTAFAAKYDANPFVAYINLTGFMQLVEMQLVQTQADRTALDALAVTDGYTNAVDAFIAGAKAIMDLFIAKFTKTTLILTSTGGKAIFGDTTARPAIENYWFSTYPDQAGWSLSSLHAVLPPHLPPTTVSYAKGYQPISGSAQGNIYLPSAPVPYPPPAQVFEDLLLNGWSLGGTFLEPYKADCDNADPAFQAVLAELNVLLVGGVPPPPPPPLVTTLTPDHGLPNDTIQLGGANFTGATSVLFGGVASGGFTVISDTIITADVPAGAVSGGVTVVTPAGQGTSVLPFTVGEEVVTEIEAPVRSPILLYPIGGRPPGKKTRPDPPTNLQVTVSGIPGDLTATASWLAPLKVGNSALTSYLGRITPSGSGVVNFIGPNDLSTTILNLSPDTLQEFHIQAVNAYGQSDEVVYDFTTNPAVIPPPPDPTLEPRGIFALIPIGPNGLPIWQFVNAWGASFIDGTTYEARWDLMEPTAPNPLHTIDFTDMDGYIANCILYSKRAIITFASGIYAPAWAKALSGTGTYTETGPDAGTMSFPWESKPIAAWLSFIKQVGARYAPSAIVPTIVPGGFGQAVNSILANNSADADRCNQRATTNGRYTSAGAAWLSAAEQAIQTTKGAFAREAFVLSSVELPVPIGTPLQSGDVALDALAMSQKATGQQIGFMTRGLTTISGTTTKRFQLVNDVSRENVPAGYRLLTASSDPALDPTQSVDTYDPLTGLTAALANAVTLKGKFVEIFDEDVDTAIADPDFETALTDAATAMLANP